MNSARLVNVRRVGSVLCYMMVSSALARIPAAARNMVEAVVQSSHHFATMVLGSGADEQLPSNVERHGRHLLVRVTVPTNRTDFRLSSGPRRY